MSRHITRIEKSSINCDAIFETFKFKCNFFFLKFLLEKQTYKLSDTGFTTPLHTAFSGIAGCLYIVWYEDHKLWFYDCPNSSHTLPSVSYVKLCSATIPIDNEPNQRGEVNNKCAFYSPNITRQVKHIVCCDVFACRQVLESWGIDLHSQIHIPVVGGQLDLAIKDQQ